MLLVQTKICLYIVGITLSVLMGLHKINNKYLRYTMYLIVWSIQIYLISSYSMSNTDNFNYFRSYQNVNQSWLIEETEKLFFLLMLTCKQIGLDYYTFRLVYSVIFILLLHYAISRMTPELSWFDAIYFCLPIFKDAEQIKMFGGYVFVIFSVYALSNNKVVGFFKNIFIAIMFHSSSIIFVMMRFIKVPKKYQKMLLKIIGIFLFAVIGFSIVNRNFAISIFSALVSFANKNKSGTYIFKRTRWGFLEPFALSLISLLLVKQIDKETFRCSDDIVLCRHNVGFGRRGRRIVFGRNIEKRLYLSDLSLGTNIMCIISLVNTPFLLMSMHFARINRVAFITIIPYLFEGYKRIHGYKKIMIVVGIVIILAGFCWLSFDLFGSLENNFYPLFME